MLPFILGGVALTAIGYGLKSHCEKDGKGCEELADGLLWISDRMEDFEDKMGLNEWTVKLSDTDASQENNLLRQVYEQREVSLKIVRKFDEVFSEVKNFDTFGVTFPSPDLSQNSTDALSESSKKSLSHYAYVLSSASGQLVKATSTLETLMAETPTDYKIMDAEQRHVVQKAFVYAGIVSELLSVKLVKKSGKISNKVENVQLKAMKWLLEADKAEHLDIGTFFS